MQIRNLLYEHNILRTHPTYRPTISVGNLAVGGTGKTPMCAFLLSMLEARGVAPALLSLGYGRKSSGLVEATDMSTAADIGDEPLEIHQALPHIPIAVCKQRYEAAKQLLSHHPEIQCFVMDDAYQHRPTHRDLNILLTDYHRLYTRDLVMPAGRLRESAAGAKRAQFIIVSKCPDNLTKDEAEAIRNELRPRPYQSVFFTSIHYQAPQTPLLNEKRVLLLTGIANPAPLAEYYRPLCASLHTLAFPDHHTFSSADISLLSDKAKTADIIVTTGKDFARLPQDLPSAIKEKLTVQRIGVNVLFGEQDRLIDNIIHVLGLRTSH